MKYEPLSARLRPQTIEEYIGQPHLLAERGALRQMIASHSAYSMVFWGPPGTGKTTLAKLIAKAADAEFIALSAVLSGIKEVRAAIAQAQVHKQNHRKTILFIDEIHRFNKSQQDAFLPHVEDGTIILIGATTENPSFELNNALLSRVRVFVLKAHTAQDLEQLLERAINYYQQHEHLQLILSEKQQHWLVQLADGDARVLLNALEMVIDFAQEGEAQQFSIEDRYFKELFAERLRHCDKGGEWFYDLISALHKSVRGSDPDASLYWLARMLDGGMEPLYIARRLIRIASEDIGNADPRALTICNDAFTTQERLGSPEGELALAQAVVYLAVAAKSNAVYIGFNQAMHDAKFYGNQPVPMHIRNAPTKLMKQLGYNKGYRYAHDEAHGYAAGETYLPDDLKHKKYYQPVDRGLEIKIKQKLEHLNKLDKAHHE